MGTVGASGQGGTETTTTDNSAAANSNVSVLAPLKTLDGSGVLRSPPATAEPIKASELDKITPSFENPPGYYGQAASPRALNVLTPKSTRIPFPDLPASVKRLSYESAERTPLKPELLAAALALLFADIIAVLLLQAGGLGGLFSRRAKHRAGAAASLAFAALGFTAVPQAKAQDFSPFDIYSPQQSSGITIVKPDHESAEDKAAIAATAKVTLAYVITGDRETDHTSRAGLSGLSRVLEARTAVEPGEPAAVNIDKDEIAFYPVLYWPVLDTAQALPDPVIAKVDAYMKKGGLIIFDTRDYGKGGADMIPLAGEGGTALQRLLSKLDVPPLEPVPENHVVTKSFYLINSFPGRWDGGKLWVEAIPQDTNDTRRARVSDGVTSIMITSNDLAAAWALDDRGRPLYPVVPGGEEQREMAFRGGVNIVMHALTGNYKSDQVHVPALLERLGQ
jgi:hypothetical protein